MKDTLDDDEIKLAGLEALVREELEKHLKLNSNRLRTFEDARQEVETYGDLQDHSDPTEQVMVQEWWQRKGARKVKETENPQENPKVPKVPKVLTKLTLRTRIIWPSTMANQTLSETIQKELVEIKDFDVVWLLRAYVSTLILGEETWKTVVLGKTLGTIKQSAIRVARRTLDNVTIQEFFDECTTAHNDLHRNRGFSPWKLLLGKTPTDNTACEDPDLAQCSVELVDEAAKQRLRVQEESDKAYIEEELSLRKRRKEIHQARPWRHWAAGEWC